MVETDDRPELRNPAGRPARPCRVLLLFVDGLGLPAGDLRSSIYGTFPALLRLLTAHCVPLDAQLGVPGLPQSATGQTAILTGLNAPALAGAHVEGFPNAQLRALIKRDNLFGSLLAQGKSCTFANAYVLLPGNHLPATLRSVTTVATLAAFGRTRNRRALLAGDAVYHDITRETVASRGVEGIPVITEAEAAAHLVSILRSVRFCLFEYFITDHVGHRQDSSGRRQVLGSLDRFIGAVLARLDAAQELLLLVSDHGNIEDGSRRGHTANPVPWVAWGCGAREALAECVSLLDVAPKIISLLTP